jgi:hypothetical protein
MPRAHAPQPPHVGAKGVHEQVKAGARMGPIGDGRNDIARPRAPLLPLDST